MMRAIDAIGAAVAPALHAATPAGQGISLSTKSQKERVEYGDSDD